MESTPWTTQSTNLQSFWVTMQFNFQHISKLSVFLSFICVHVCMGLHFKIYLIQRFILVVTHPKMAVYSQITQTLIEIVADDKYIDDDSVV